MLDLPRRDSENCARRTRRKGAICATWLPLLRGRRSAAPAQEYRSARTNVATGVQSAMLARPASLSLKYSDNIPIRCLKRIDPGYAGPDNQRVDIQIGRASCRERV